MAKMLLSGVAGLSLMLGVALMAQAADEVTLTGKMQCAKCTLKETKACQNVLTVKDGDNEVKYYLTGGAAKKAHKKVCPPDSSAEATVTGKVSEKDGKKMLEASKVDYK